MIIRDIKKDDLDAAFTLAVKNGFKLTPEQWEVWSNAISEFRSIGYVMLDNGVVVGAVIAGHDGINSHIQLFATNQEVVNAEDGKRLLAEMVKRLKSQSPARAVVASSISESWFDGKSFDLTEFKFKRIKGSSYCTRFDGPSTDAWPTGRTEGTANSNSIVSLLLSPLLTAIGKNQLLSFAVASVVALVLITPFAIDFFKSIKPMFAEDGKAGPKLELAEMERNSTEDISILERSDFIDLDAVVAVPHYVLDRHQDAKSQTPKISPTIRFTRLKIKKRRPCEYFYYHAKSSSRTPPDIVCLSDLDSKFEKVKWTPSRADQFLDMFQLQITIREKPTKTPFEIEWNRVGWNKFIGPDNWWTSAFVTGAVNRLELNVDFPEGSGIGLSDIYLMIREKDSQPVKVELDKAKVDYDASLGLLTWIVEPALQDTEYRVHWTKDITLPRKEH